MLDISSLAPVAYITEVVINGVLILYENICNDPSLEPSQTVIMMGYVFMEKYG